MSLLKPEPITITHVENLGDFKLKMLVYGNPGVGKTYLSCTMPKPLIVLTEGDVSKPTILAVQKKLKIKLDIVEISKTTELEDVFSYLKAFPTKWDSVVLDSLSDINRMKMGEVLSNSIAARATHEPDILEIDDWNRLDAWSRRMIRDFRDLPMNVLMTARTLNAARMTASKRSAVGAPKEEGVLPELYPAGLRSGVSALFNAVGYLGWLDDFDKKTRSRALVFGGDAKFLTKSMGDLLPDVVEEPNLTKVISDLG